MNMRFCKRLILLAVTVLLFSMSLSVGNASTPSTPLIITCNKDITNGMTDDEYVFTVTGNDGLSAYAQLAYSIKFQSDPLHPDDLETQYTSDTDETYGSTLTYTIRYTFSKKGTYILIVTLRVPLSTSSTEKRLVIHITNGGADCSNGHTWGAPAYTWAANSLQVTAKRVCEECGVQESETVNATSAITTPATCTGQGVLTYTSAAFQNEAFEIQTKNAPIAAAGHSPVIDAAVPSTCTETGLTEGSHCSVCGTILNEQQVVPTTAHALISHTALEPTCTSAGNNAYWSCSVCGKFFSDDNANHEIAENEWVLSIDENAHDWGAPTYEWTDDNLSVTATRTCAHDTSHKETETVSATGTETVAASCETDGTMTYSSAVFQNSAFAIQTKTVPIPRLGHTFSTPVYTWAQDYSTVTASRTCMRNCGHAESETVPTISAVTRAAACEAMGETTYTATFTNGAFETQTKTVENIAALGHDYGEPTYTWEADFSKVTATRTCTHDANHMETETVHTTSSVTKPATCEGKGETTYTASFTNTAFESQTKTVENIDVLGHDYGEPAYVWAEDCSTVTATRTCTHDANHKETETVSTTPSVTKPATCEGKGETTYTVSFANPAFVTQTKAVENIDALGHRYGTPTYTWEADNSSVTATRTCAHDANHKETETVHTTPSVTKPATCEGKGETTYTASFTNPAFESQAKTIENINALGHDYSEPTYTWAPDYSTVTALRTCTRHSGHAESETVSTISAVTKAATCEEKGKTTYTASFTNTAFESQTKTVENINAMGHRYGTPTYTWAEDYSSVTAARTCAHDANHMETETVHSTSSVTKPATCEGKGETTYTVSFANPAFESQTKTIENINALGHDYGIPTYTWEADHSSVTATRICTRNTSHIETETALATGAETVAAACETDGSMTYSSAVFQNSAFIIQTKTVPIPRLGHAFSTPIYTWAKDYSSVTASRTCTRHSDHVEAETVSTISAITKAATCEEPGKTTYTAAFENDAFETQTKTLTNLSALSHDWNAPTYEWAADYKSITATRTCKNGNHPETETVSATASVALAATCETKGKTTYTVSFQNPVFAAEPVTVEDLPALGHAWETPIYEWADDLSTVKATRTCSHNPEHTESETVHTTSAVTKAAACEIPGESTYTAVFTNSSFATQTKTVANVSALSHAWNAPTYAWAADNSTVTATRTCKNGDHPETETVAATSSITIASTCTETGIRTYTSAAFKNGAFTVQAKETDIPSLGHDYGAPSYTWADDNSKVTATRTCSRNDAHTETETVKTTSAVTKDAACEAAGETTYTAAFTNGAFAAQSKVLANIPALGHNWNAPTYEWAADNSTVTAARACSRNDAHTETETVKTTSAVTIEAACEEAGEITYTAEFTKAAFSTQTKKAETDPKGHRPVKDPAVAPTYTEEGRTEGSHCGDCGNILVEQKVLPKLVAETPETPDTPQTPDTPVTPDTPEIPETPASDPPATEPDTPVSEPDPPAAEPDTPEAKIRAFVSRCYQLILNREADEGGLTGWSDALIGKTATAAQIIDGFVRSDEFTNRNLPDSDKVDILYRTMLNREADAGGKAGWVDALSKGYTLQNIIDGFCGSDEFKTLSQEYGIEPGSVCAAAPTDTSTPRGKIEAFVKRCYQLILNRQADDGGLKGWSDALESKTAAAAQIIDGFVRSPEYINRNLTNDQSVTILYKTMLDREPDEGGKAGWVDALSKGYTLQHIINGFCGSAEFTKICSDYGIQAGSVAVPTQSAAALEAQKLPDERIGNAVSAVDAGIMVVNGYEPAEVEAFVKHAYRAALGREADEAGLAGWTEQIVSGAVTPKAFLRTLLFSDEQIARKLNNEQYIDMLYHLYLNRGADEAAAGWIEVLVTAGHDKVIRGFENSAEFRDLCSQYGITPGSVK